MKRINLWRNAETGAVVELRQDGHWYLLDWWRPCEPVSHCTFLNADYADYQASIMVHHFGATEVGSPNVVATGKA